MRDVLRIVVRLRRAGDEEGRAFLGLELRSSTQAGILRAFSPNATERTVQPFSPFNPATGTRQVIFNAAPSTLYP